MTTQSFFCIRLPIFIGMPNIGFSGVGLLGGEFHKRYIGREKGIHLIKRLDGFMKSSQRTDNK